MAMSSSEMTGDDIQVPSTPPPGRSRSVQSNHSLNKSFSSPPPMSASMTPPPSTQPPRFHSPIPRASLGTSDSLLVSPPTTVKTSSSSALPNADAIASASIEELRTMARELVAAVTEARMSAAHFKLQHSLLAMETHEAAQRAEIEHQMTKREVEVLQAVEQRNRVAASVTPRNSVPPVQPQVDALVKTCKDLEEERDAVARKLQRAKKLIQIEKDNSELLLEANLLLKKRIRENREHFTTLKTQSPNYITPRDNFTTPQRRAPPRFADTTSSHQPFAALLAADQVLNGESLSVPSTPTKSNPPKIKLGHTRGAHSLSSLHATPGRTRPVTSDGFADPKVPLLGSQLAIESAERERHDRDSTISMSDVDDISDDDVIQSQASSLATDMLRKNPATQESLRLSQNAERSSNLLQTKIFGSVKKPGVERNHNGKRSGSFGEAEVKSKKARLGEGVGLGIEAWSQS